MKWHLYLKRNWLMASACLFAIAEPVSAEPVSAEIEPLDHYPIAERLWLCHVRGSLGPLQQEPILSDGNGTIRILKEHNSNVSKNDAIAVFRPEHLEIEREVLHLEKTMLGLQIQDALVSWAEKISSIESQKAELEMSLRELEAAGNLKEVPVNSDLHKKVKEAISNTQQKLELINARLATHYKIQPSQIEVAQLKVEQKRKDLDFSNLERTSHHMAKFDGDFSLTEALAAEHGAKKAPFEFWIQNSELIGHVTDNSSYEIIISQYPPILNQSPQNDLTLEVQLDANQPPVTAKFKMTLGRPTSGIGGKEDRALVFEVIQEDKQHAKTFSDSEVYGQIFVTLPAGCHLIPKSEIIKKILNNKTKSGGWQLWVNELWPQSELVAIGNQHIAVRMK